jgi:hypothetical protein
MNWGHLCFWSLVIGHWSLVIGHWSLVIGYWSLVIGENYSSFFFLLTPELLIAQRGVSHTPELLNA